MLRCVASRRWASVRAKTLGVCASTPFCLHSGVRFMETERGGVPVHVDQADAKEAALVTSAGVVVNIGLAAIKGGAGFLAASPSLMADAVHSLSDLVSDAVALVSVKVARAPADSNHPYGHGKFETLGTLAISGILMAAGFSLCVFSYDNALTLVDLLAQEVPPPPPASPLVGQAAVGACAVSIFSKEVLYHWTVAVGRRIHSPVLQANAWHHRSDAFSSVFALVGVGGGLLGMPLLDPFGGMIVGLMVAKVGLDFGVQSVRELSDETVDDDLIRDLQGLLQLVPGVLGYRRLRTRRMGPYILVDVEVKVDHTLSISSAQQVAHRAQQAILDANRNVTDAMVGVYSQDIPVSRSMRPVEVIKADVMQAALLFREIHDVTHTRLHFLHDGPSTVEMEVVLEKACATMTVDEVHALARRVRKAVEAVPDVEVADLHLELDDD